MKKTYPVGLTCQLLGVSRSAYYDYVQRKGNRRSDPYHEGMLDAVRDIAKSSHYTYGSRRMRKALHELNYLVGRWKARRLMKEAGVQVKHRKKYKVTTKSNHKQPVFENKLNRQFDVVGPDQAYVGDITYLWTQEGWLYLAVVIDLFSRKVVGWSMSSRMKAHLVCDALQMAIWQRRPESGLIVHSDRGSQYASKEHRRLLQTHGFIGSMSRKGNCWEGSVLLKTLTATLRLLAKRWLMLSAELKELDATLDHLTSQSAKRLRNQFGVGPQTAAILIAVAGDNPERLKNEAALAALCGASPLQASSGKTVRHRLNRGGDRSANNALWAIAMVRMRSESRTQAYVMRRTAQGMSNKEIQRCLKRYIVRELYPLILADLSDAATIT